MPFNFAFKILFCSFFGNFSIISDNSLVTPVTECVTTSISSASADISSALAIATKVSNFVTFSPLSITLTCSKDTESTEDVLVL